MSEDKTPWWYPKPVNAETVQRLRKGYPEDTEGLDDEEVLEMYELVGCRYQWLWDHTGEAAEQADKLADEIFRLKAEVERLQRVVRLAYAEGFEDGRYAAEDCRVPSDPKNPSERTEAMAKILAEFWEASESKKCLFRN